MHWLVHSSAQLLGGWSCTGVLGCALECTSQCTGRLLNYALSLADSWLCTQVHIGSALKCTLHPLAVASAQLLPTLVPAIKCLGKFKITS